MDTDDDEDEVKNTIVRVKMQMISKVQWCDIALNYEFRLCKLTLKTCILKYIISST